MFVALAAAGHDVALVVRSFVAPIAPLLAPHATVISLEPNPYSPALDLNSDSVLRVLADAREFAPDVLCIAPYQRTALDEWLAQSLDCPTVGMDGFLYPGYIRAGLSEKSKIRLDRPVTVPLEQHELEKNERLCGNCWVSLPVCRIRLWMPTRATSTTRAV